MAFPIPEEPPVIKTTLLIVAFIGLTKNKKSSRRLLCLNSKIETEIFRLKKWQATYIATAQPRTLCSHPGSQ
jgi:hypothetical protein